MHRCSPHVRVSFVCAFGSGGAGTLGCRRGAPASGGRHRLEAEARSGVCAANPLYMFEYMWVYGGFITQRGTLEGR